MNFLIIGDSNANSTRVDLLWSGVTVQPGWVYRHNGTNQTTYPSGNLPGVGCLPYLAELAMDAGHPTGTLIRRGKNGGTAMPGSVGPQWTGAKADAVALGVVPDVVILCFGANDSKQQAYASAFLANLDAIVDSVHGEWPAAKVVLWKERCTDAAVGNYPYLRTTIYDAIAAIAADNPAFVFVADSTVSPVADLVDAIHFSTAGTGGGQEEMAERTFAALGL